MPDGTEARVVDGLTISPSAAERIAKLKQIEGNDALMLRVSVSGGGCSGFQYGFTLDESLNDDDRVFESAGVRVVADEISLDLLKGSQVNFVDDLIGSFFSVDNPNATSSCGCGTSFSICAAARREAIAPSFRTARLGVHDQDRDLERELRQGAARAPS